MKFISCRSLSSIFPDASTPSNCLSIKPIGISSKDFPSGINPLNMSIPLTSNLFPLRSVKISAIRITVPLLYFTVYTMPRPVILNLSIILNKSLIMPKMAYRLAHSQSYSRQSHLFSFYIIFFLKPLAHMIPIPRFC